MNKKSKSAAGLQFNDSAYEIVVQGIKFCYTPSRDIDIKLFSLADTTEAILADSTLSKMEQNVKVDHLLREAVEFVLGADALSKIETALGRQLRFAEVRALADYIVSVINRDARK